MEGVAAQEGKDMKSLLACVVLAVLPVLAGADQSVSVAQCAEVAQRFSSDPRGLGISDLDQLKTCITTQKEALISANPQQQAQAQVAVVNRMPRRVLHDDL
jgi:hypothetical protein